MGDRCCRPLLASRTLISGRLMRRVFAAILFCLALSSAAFSQSTFRGGLSGIVTDTQGGVVAGAQVQAVNAATGVVYKTASFQRRGLFHPGRRWRRSWDVAPSRFD